MNSNQYKKTVDEMVKYLCVLTIMAQTAMVMAADKTKSDIHAKTDREVFLLLFDDPTIWKLSAHVGEKPATVPEGTMLARDDKNTCDGKPTLKLKYQFPSAKHDAVMLTTDVSIPSGKTIGLRIYGDGSGHALFVVLIDNSGEAHYLPIGPASWRGWQTVNVSLVGLCNGPASKWDVSCNHWGGDGNQTLEFPITRISVGLNDQPDEFQGEGEIIFGWLKVYN